MGEKRRFISRGLSWTNGAVTLDRGGLEFDGESDRELIAGIIKDGVLAGGMVIEAPNGGCLSAAALDFALGDALIQARIQEEAKRLAEAMTPPKPVEPLAVAHPDQELAALGEEQRIRRQQEAAEAALTEERKAEAEKYQQRFKNKTVKKAPIKKPTIKKGKAGEKG